MSRRLLTDLRLFVGVDGEVIPDGVVLIDGGVIAFAGPASDAPSVDGDVARSECGPRRARIHLCPVCRSRRCSSLKKSCRL